MFVKICGVSNAVDADFVSKSGAAAIGFVMGGKVFPVEVEPSAQEVREIIKNLRSGLETVLVTHLCSVKDILDLADYIACSAIQVSEPIPVESLEKLRKATKRLIIKTVGTESANAAQYLETVSPLCDYILLDTCVGGYIGGTGRTSDWNICRRLVSESSRPVLLAGGLNPENVAEALRLTKAHGADVSTGISTFSDSYPRKDRKDPLKISEFIRVANEAL